MAETNEWRWVTMLELNKGNVCELGTKDPGAESWMDVVVESGREFTGAAGGQGGDRMLFWQLIRQRCRLDIAELGAGGSVLDLMTKTG